MRVAWTSFTTVCAVLLLEWLPRPASAQVTPTLQSAETRQRARVPVTVVLQDTTAATPSFRILRRVNQRPLDLIILSGPADGGTLSEAIRNLLMVRQIAGDTAARAAQVRVRRQATAGLSRRPYPWAERVVRDLRSAVPRVVAGIGAARAVEIWLPPQHHATQ